MKKTILAMILAGSSAAVSAQDTTITNQNNMDTARNQSSTGNYNAYGAATMPPTIQRNFQAQYPGATDAQWQPTFNGFWRASYRHNGQLMTVNYAPNGESFMVAMPVLQSSVPQEILNRAIELYGNNVYDVSLVKLPNPEVAAMDSMIAAAVMNPPPANTGVTGTDTTAMMDNTTGDTSTTVPSGVTSYPPNTFWGVDTTGRAAMPRTIDLYLVRIIDNGILRAQRMNADGSPDLSYGTTMTAPMPSNVNMNNNMNQNLTTTNVSTMTTPTYSDYYNMGTTGVSTNVNTSAYPAKDSAAMVDSSAAAPITDTTSANPVTDTTATNPVTDTTVTNPVTDTTSRSVSDTTGTSSANSAGDVNTTTNDTKVQTEAVNTGTGTSSDMNNNTNTNKKNKKNKKTKSTNSTDGTSGSTGTSGGD